MGQVKRPAWGELEITIGTERVPVPIKAPPKRQPLTRMPGRVGYTFDFSCDLDREAYQKLLRAVGLADRPIVPSPVLAVGAGSCVSTRSDRVNWSERDALGTMFFAWCP